MLSRLRAEELGERGLVLARTLVNVPTEVVPVRVLNANKEERVIRAGTTTATVTPIKVEAIRRRGKTIQ